MRAVSIGLSVYVLASCGEGPALEQRALPADTLEITLSSENKLPEYASVIISSGVFIGSSVVIADPVLGEIAFLDDGAKDWTVLLKRGEGPHGIQSVADLIKATPDSVFASDHTGARLTLITGDPVTVGSTREVRVPTRNATLRGVKGEWLYFEAAPARNESGVFHDELVIVRTRFDGTDVDTVAAVDGPDQVAEVSSSVGGGAQSIRRVLRTLPASIQDYWIPRESGITVVGSEPPQVAELSAEGDPVRTREMPMALLPLEPEQRRRLDSLGAPLPKHAPPWVGRLRAGPDGELYIGVTSTSKALYLQLDRRLSPQRWLSLPAGARILDVDHESYLVAARDEDGVEALYQVPRSEPGSE